MNNIKVNSHGVNAKIKANILPEEDMRKIGFTDFSKGTWYFCRNIINKKSKRAYGGIDFEYP